MGWIGLVLPAGVAMLLPRLPHDHGLTSHGRPWAVASWTRVLSTGSNFELRWGSVPCLRSLCWWPPPPSTGGARCSTGGEAAPMARPGEISHQIQVRTAEMIIRQRFSIKGNQVVFYRRKIKLEQPVQQSPPGQLKMNKCFFEIIFSREE